MLVGATGAGLRVRVVRRVGVGRTDDTFAPFPGEAGDSVPPLVGDCSTGVSAPEDSVEEPVSIGCVRRRAMSATQMQKHRPILDRHAPVLRGRLAAKRHGRS
jgi:hypothetical protein